MSLFLKGFFPDFSLPLDSGDGWVKMATNCLVCKMCKWICKLMLYPLSSLSKEMTPLSGPLFEETAWFRGPCIHAVNWKYNRQGTKAQLARKAGDIHPRLRQGKNFPVNLMAGPGGPKLTPISLPHVPWFLAPKETIAFVSYRNYTTRKTRNQQSSASLNSPIWVISDTHFATSKSLR